MVLFILGFAPFVDTSATIVRNLVFKRR